MAKFIFILPPKKLIVANYTTNPKVKKTRLLRICRGSPPQFAAFVAQIGNLRYVYAIIAVR
ncbi:MAG: hypothetical protein HY869_12730 [Chloroflexi bacterium]|nr:hypothetical protein [Chloroflexota bacterium]